MSKTFEITEKNVQVAVDAAVSAVSASASLADLKKAKTEHLGEHSTLSHMNATLRDLPSESKAAAGKMMGEAKALVSSAFAARESELESLEESARLSEERLDLTSVGPRGPRGARHPLTMLMEDMADVFVAMGWEIAEGPELEHEWFNFDALNFDEDHPARALQDTFFIEPVDRHVLLRTHTSPVQIRSLLTRELPVYVVAPGRVYRTDELDATHTPVFHQIEGIAIDKGLTMAHLRGTLEHLARECLAKRRRFVCGQTTFLSPSPALSLISGTPRSAGERAGLNGAVAEW